MTTFGLLKAYPPPAWNSPSSPTTTTAQERKSPSPDTSCPVEPEKEDVALATPSPLPPMPVSLPVPPPANAPPPFMDSVDKLLALSNPIQSFKASYDDLTNHLDSIQRSINSFSNQTSQTPIPPISIENPVSDAIAKLPLAENNNDANTANDGTTEDKINANKEKEKEKQSSSKSELESLCETMHGKGLRKYIVSRLYTSDASKLRKTISEAIKLCPKPSRLVLDCIGRFFLQGSRAFATNNSNLTSCRRASVLISECFLLSDMVGVENEVCESLRREAEESAIGWRKRLLAEGGISRASQMDARGLLMFVACFGAPRVFSDEDIRTLILCSNPRCLSNALRKTPFLSSRIIDIIEGMMKSGMLVQAVNIIYTFGLEEKYPPYSILTSFLRESKDEWSRKKEDSQGSPNKLKEANQMKLAALRSVMECLEYHKIDPSKLLPGWKLKETIANLEGKFVEVGDSLDEKTMQKRKASEMQCSRKLKREELKRSRPSTWVSPQIHHAGLADQRTVGYVDLDTSHGQIRTRDGGSSGSLSSYYSTIPGGVCSLGPGIRGMPAGHGESLYTSIYRDDIQVDYKAGQIMNQSGQPYAYAGVTETAYTDQVIGQNLAKDSSMVANRISGPSSSFTSFPGLSNLASTAGVANRSSDLYGFADAVPEVGSSYHASLSQRGGMVSPAQHTSYFYHS